MSQRWTGACILFESSKPSNYKLLVLKTATGSHQTVHNSCLAMCISWNSGAQNHSLRATTTTRLYHSGVDEQLVMERTGHRSLEGVRSYKRTSDTQREALSDILNHPKQPRVHTVASVSQLPPSNSATSCHCTILTFELRN